MLLNLHFVQLGMAKDTWPTLKPLRLLFRHLGLDAFSNVQRQIHLPSQHFDKFFVPLVDLPPTGVFNPYATGNWMKN